MDQVQKTFPVFRIIAEVTAGQDNMGGSAAGRITATVQILMALYLEILEVDKVRLLVLQIFTHMFQRAVGVAANGFRNVSVTTFRRLVPAQCFNGGDYSIATNPTYGFAGTQGGTVLHLLTCRLLSSPTRLFFAGI